MVDWGEKWRGGYAAGKRMSIQVAMAMKLSLSHTDSWYGRTMQILAAAMTNSWD